MPLVGGLGAATPLGRTAWASAAAVRAGVSSLAAHRFMVDSEGEPIVVAECPWLTEEPRPEIRISDCLITAVRSAIEPVHGAAVPQRAALPITLIVNLPPPRPGLPPRLGSLIRPLIDRAFPGVFARTEMIERGHAGGLVALKWAIDLLARGGGGACVVAGADSFIDPDCLEWLEDTDQLHGAGPRNNAWGFTPGEGAGAVLILSAQATQGLGVPALGRFRRVGLSREAHLIRTGTVCIGQGLSAAFAEALSDLPANARLTDVYCDMNGEPYRADEFGFAVARTRERFVSATDFVAPADRWGDMGAASAPLGIMLACIATAKAYANGPWSLIWGSSDQGDRGAVVVESVFGVGRRG